MRHSKIENPAVRDAIVAAWPSSDDELQFNDIVKHLHRKGIISSELQHATVSRWLKKLIENEKILEKTKTGYKLKLKPGEFQLFDYLNDLRKKYEGHYYSGEVGGWFWKNAAIAILGFSDEDPRNYDEAIALQMLLVRLGELFGALESLRNLIVERRAGLPMPMTDVVDREVFFALLQKSVSDEGTTDELVNKYRNRLRYSNIAEKYFPKEKPRSPLEEGPFDAHDIRQVLHDIRPYREWLRSEGLNIDKHDLEGPTGLIRKFEEVSTRVWSGKADYTSDDLDLESRLQTAILVKAAEAIKAMNSQFDFDDLAVVLTRHPSTMAPYYTAEHVLYDAMKWAIEEPTEDWFRGLWLQLKERLKTREAMIADYLVSNARFSVEEYRKLRAKPWLRDLAKHADLDKILMIYEKKHRERTREQERFMKAVECDTKGMKSIDINKAVDDDSATDERISRKP